MREMIAIERLAQSGDSDASAEDAEPDEKASQE